MRVPNHSPWAKSLNLRFSKVSLLIFLHCLVHYRCDAQNIRGLVPAVAPSNAASTLKIRAAFLTVDSLDLWTQVAGGDCHIFT